ncbi:MAG: DUF1987 domain-containing protein [Crocinitomicaceae bacterium]|nr:DUF1987 domain-containing protein [Crocinitomicaceae bacterium]
MNPLRIQATAKTPEVLLDPSNNIFEIKGKSVPEDADAFYNLILKWFDDYVVQPNESTLLRVDLEYFNISSSKRLLFLLYKLNELQARGADVKIQWFYSEADEDMFEVGQDYAFMVKIPFQFVEREAELELAS